MLLGYNTNGFAHHDLPDALALISEIGYAGVALTLERHQLNPADRSGVATGVAQLQPLLERSALAVTVETGSRFILDPRRKHQPTLISRSSDDRQRRIEFIKAAIDIAHELSASCVSLWSGVSDDGADRPELWDRLTGSLNELLEHAARRNARLAFEPEPGMFIDTMERFQTLHSAIDHPLFGLTLDVGHIHCLGDGDMATHAGKWRDKLWNVHIEDMKRGTHEHLMFGEGEMCFDDTFAALRDIEYSGPINVELSRHSHNAVEAAIQSYKFLRPYVETKSR